MTKPLTQDQRVIADTSIDGVYQDGTAYVVPIVIGEEGKDFWRYPLTDEMVERLAKAMYENHDDWLCPRDGDDPTPWDSVDNDARDQYCSDVRAVFAELMDGGER